MTGGHGCSLLFSQAAEEVGHFDGGDGGVVALIAAFAARAIDGLLDGIRGQYSEGHGYAALEGHCRQPAGSLRRHVVKMRCFSADYGSQGDDCIVTFLPRQRFRYQRQLPGTWNFDDFHVIRISTRALQRVRGAGQQAIGDEAVESRANNRKLEPARIQISFDHLRHMG